MRVRKLDANGDMQFGRSQADFYKDVPEAPAQCVKTRLGEYVGDWFLDITAGTGWRTNVLGARTASTRDIEMRTRILGTTGVVSIVSYASQILRANRGYSVQATINTAFGQTLVATQTTAANVDVREGR